MREKRETNRNRRRKEKATGGEINADRDRIEREKKVRMLKG